MTTNAPYADALELRWHSTILGEVQTGLYRDDHARCEGRVVVDRRCVMNVHSWRTRSFTEDFTRGDIFEGKRLFWGVTRQKTTFLEIVKRGDVFEDKELYSCESCRVRFGPDFLEMIMPGARGVS